MRESKLLRQLKALSADELIRFKEFVHSPFFNKHLPTTQLFDYIHPQLYTLTHLDKKAIFKSIYGKASFKEHKVNNLMSYLMGLLERFHGQLLWDKKKTEQRLLELGFAYQKNQTALFKSLQLRIKKHLENSDIQDSRFYFHQHRFYLLHDYFSLQQGDRMHTDLLLKQVEAFDLYYISEKLKFSCDMVSRMEVLNQKFELHFLPELLGYLRANRDRFQAIPTIEVYYSLLQMLRESKKEEHYHQFKHLLTKHYKRFSQEEAQLLYDYAENYCVQKINEGETSYLREIFRLYQQLIESKLILKNGLLLEWDYKNIVTVGCRLEAYEWTQDFIENYKSYLPLPVQENAFTYNLAAFYYSTKQYNDALLLLQQLEFTDVHYHLGAKFIQCKIYYELAETEALLSLLDSFRIYLLRNKSMAKKEKQAPLNFIRLTKKLVLLREKKALLNTEKFQQLLEKLKANIQQSTAIVDLDWLVEKLDTI